MNEKGPGLCYLNFRVKVHTNHSETACILGSAPGLGEWNPAHLVTCVTERDMYPWWVSKKAVCVRAGEKICFKLVC